ncbi:MAG: DUF1566 domain-containing protein [Deltaproteobacteria bacterium]|nr:DUF1566 domain-containing protein [Deltaproteobacteria bacterium]
MFEILEPGGLSKEGSSSDIARAAIIPNEKLSVQPNNQKAAPVSPISNKRRITYDTLDLEAGTSQKLSMIKTVEKTSNYMKLRAEGKKLSEQDVSEMFTKWNFFDRNKNQNGDFENRFVDNRDGTVTDKATNLMWTKGGKTCQFDDIQAYIAEINEAHLGGKRDWRLPTLEELASLMEKRKPTAEEVSMSHGGNFISENSGETDYNICYLDPVFDHEASKWCWSSDMFSVDKAWIAFFWKGYLKSEYLDWNVNVKAVRNID